MEHMYVFVALIKDKSFKQHMLLHIPTYVYVNTLLIILLLN